MDTDIWRFLCACTGSDEPQPLFCAAEAIAEVEAGRPNSLFAVHHRGQWYSYAATPDWTAVAVASVRDPSDSLWVVVGISAAGHVWELRPRTRVETSGQLPRETGMTNLGAVDQTVFACGMGRVVYRREPGGGSWTDISAPWPDASEGVVGFTAIAGRDASLVYAVGWKGEIWALSEGRWRAEDSPTNANLNAVAVSDDGEVYCVGDDGVMLHGRNGMWTMIDTGTDVDLQDVCMHGGEVFVASDFQVFRLEDGFLTLDLAGDGDSSLTCLKLRSGGRGGVLYSLGTHDVFQRTDEGWGRLA
ncbi:hypothetical protein [Nocardia sp. NPDC050710]|uniref:WD40/YVTN/BNR-like repeat-containing protein n=1 Tax=Nocardia sp. NPDC050710 TaxID=3157220 RepID=UPI0033D107C0